MVRTENTEREGASAGGLFDDLLGKGPPSERAITGIEEEAARGHLMG